MTPWLQPTRLLCPWDFPGKSTGVCGHFLLQGIFPTQGSNLRPLHWQAGSSPLSHQGSQSEGESCVNGLPYSMAVHIYPLNCAMIETSLTRSGGRKGEGMHEVASERGMILRENLAGWERVCPADRGQAVILSRENSTNKVQIPPEAWPFHGTAGAVSWPEHRVPTGGVGRSDFGKVGWGQMMKGLTGCL